MISSCCWNFLFTTRSPSSSYTCSNECLFLLSQLSLLLSLDCLSELQHNEHGQNSQLSLVWGPSRWQCFSEGCIAWLLWTLSYWWWSSYEHKANEKRVTYPVKHKRVCSKTRKHHRSALAHQNCLTYRQITKISAVLGNNYYISKYCSLRLLFKRISH